MLLLKNDSYVLIDSIDVKAYGTNFMTLSFRNILPKDSVSSRISKIVHDKALAAFATERETAEMIRETFNQTYTDQSRFTNTMTGKVYGPANEILIGASVSVKGIRGGVTTGPDGSFRIKVPSTGTLVFSQLGFQTNEVPIQPGSHIQVVLKESMNSLNEVVVVGYGTQKRSQLTGTLAGLSVGQQDIRIRGTASLRPGLKPLVIVDGVPYEGDADDFSPDNVADVAMLKDAAATAIYGERAAAGVIVITTKKGRTLSGKTDAQTAEGSLSIRRNFSDNAFWQPRLRTNAEGKASFNVNFPDDITNWRTYFIAMSAKEQSGFAQGSVKAFKQVSANFVSPSFAVEGDEFSPLGKVLNYTTDSIRLNRRFSYNNQNLLKGSITVKNAVIDTFKVRAGGTDSLKFEYTIEKPDVYFDGEVRQIPLYKAGVQESKGFFNVLEGDTSITLQFDPRFGPVTVRAETSSLPVLVEETNKLRNYQYLCNEQLASKLKALLAQKRIKAYLKDPFLYDKDIRQLIKKLQESRHVNGMWGWWRSSDSELWISKHVIEALLDAEKEGYKIDIDKKKMVDELVYQLSRVNGVDKIQALQILKKMDAQVDYKTPIALYEKEQKMLKGRQPQTLYEKMQIWRLKQQLGEAFSIDSLMHYSHRTLLGNLYFGEPGYAFFNNSIQNTLLAYTLLKNSGKSEHLLKSLRYYLLEQRRSNEWRNTYETALILETILPDMIHGGNKPGKSAISFSGGLDRTVTEFPFTLTADDNSRITIKKQGDLPVYLSAYQQFCNAEPQEVKKDFAVKTSFETSDGQPLLQLKGGEPAILKTEVKVNREAEYVMIEIPIPAGCSYEEKEQQWWGNEVYREYFKNKVSIFCRKLTEGNFVFKVKLLPRYSGNYNLNPAKAELMYFPVFYGREGMKKIRVD